METFVRKNVLIGLAELLCRLPLVFTVGYLARSVGAEIFGNWAVILALQVFVVGIAGLGLPSSLSRHVPATRGDEAAAYLRYAFVFVLSAILFLCILTFLFRAQIGALIGIKSGLYWLLPVAIVLAAGSVADGLLDAFFKARLAVARQIAFVASRTLAEVVAVVFVFAISPGIFGDASSRLAAYVGVVVLAKMATYPWLLTGMTSDCGVLPRDARREFLKYGLPMVPTVLAAWVVSQGDRLVLSHFVAKADLGVYAFGASLSGYLVLLGYAVYPLLLPGASRLHDAGDADGVRAMFLGAQRLFMVLWAGAMTCLALMAGEIISWTGGSAYAGASRVFVILCFAVGVEQLMGIYQYVFHLVKRTDVIFWLNAGYAAAIVVALAVAGAVGGIAAAPWAVLAVAVIFNFVRYFVAQRYLPIPIGKTVVLGMATLAIATVLVARYAAEWNVGVRLAMAVVIGLVLAAQILRRGSNSGVVAAAENNV